MLHLFKVNKKINRRKAVDFILIFLFLNLNRSHVFCLIVLLLNLSRQKQVKALRLMNARYLLSAWLSFRGTVPSDINMLKVNKRNARIRSEMCSLWAGECWLRYDYVDFQLSKNFLFSKLKLKLHGFHEVKVTYTLYLHRRHSRTIVHRFSLKKFFQKNSLNSQKHLCRTPSL